MHVVGRTFTIFASSSNLVTQSHSRDIALKLNGSDALCLLYHRGFPESCGSCMCRHFANENTSI